MALIDVSELLTDPDFVDQVMLVTAHQGVNELGMNQLIYNAAVTVDMALQDTSADDYIKYIGHTFSNNSLTVFSAYPLIDKEGYTTFIYHNDRKWRLHKIAEDWFNHGQGYQKAIFILDKTS